METVLEINGIKYAVFYSYIPEVSGIYDGPPENCRPSEPAEIESVMAYDAKGNKAPHGVVKQILCDHWNELISIAEDYDNDMTTDRLVA